MSLMISVGARVRKSPFFAATREAGLAAASVYNHMFMPTSYGDPAAEYDRLVNGVAMWDVACLLYTSPSPRDRQKSRMPSSA